MSVGLPGSGIGGVFYLVSALLMPVDGAWRAARRPRTVRRDLLVRQTLLALSIVAALIATAWLIEQLILRPGSPGFVFGPGSAFAQAESLPRVLRAATLGLTFGTLGAVLLAVQILRLFCAAPPHRPAPDEVSEREAA